MSRQSFLLLTAGFIVATLLVAPVVAHRGDLMDYWVPWQAATARWRPWNAYAVPGCNYPPVVLYILSICEWARSALDVKGKSPVNIVLLKIPSLIAQLVGAVALFRSLRAEFGTRHAVWIAACWLLSAGLFVNTAMWGQWDAILALLGLLALLTFRENRPLLTGAYVALALATKVQAIFLLPVLGVYLLARRNLRAAALTAAGGLLALALCFAPMAIAGKLRESTAVYTASVDTFPFRSVNAWNPWSIVNSLELRGVTKKRAKTEAMSDAQPIFASVKSFTSKRLGLLLFATYLAALLVVVARRRAPLDVVVGTPLVGIAMFVLLTQMHERYAAAPAAMMVLWLPLGRPYRFQFWFWSISSAINQIYVLGRYSFLSERLEPFMDASFTSVGNVVAVLNVLAFLHLTWLFYRPRVAAPATDQPTVPTVSCVA